MEKTSSDFVVETYLPVPDPSHRCPNDIKGWNDDDEGCNHDRLSALPDILCQHILSFLPPKDARLMSFLSKRWRFMWCSCPSFAFNEREFHKPPYLLQWHRSRQNFMRFVDQTLEFRNRHFSELSIDKFKVRTRFVDEVRPYLDRWISFALERNVKELSIIAEVKDPIVFHPFRMPYPLPVQVFTTRSIRHLELSFCDVMNVTDCSINLPLLQSLDMINVRINDSTFKSILSNSLLLQKINLSLVCGLDRIKFSGENLKMLVIFKCSPLQVVVVKAPNLESFLFRGKRHTCDRIDVSSCRKLKFLWLQRAANVTDDLLENVTGQNPNLEILILSHCPALKNVALKSMSLRMLVLFKCKHLMSARIDAPTLHTFEYSGHMISFPTVASSAQLDAVIHIERSEICTEWHVKLKEMCGRFDHCRTLWIRCNDDSDLIMPHEMRGELRPQLNGLTELKIHVRNETTNLSQLEEGIRWIFPRLRNLYLETNGTTHHFQYGGATGDVGIVPNWWKCRQFIQAEGEMC